MAREKMEKEKTNDEAGQTQVIIQLNKQFYDLNSVNESIQDFNEVCTGKIDDKSEHEIKVILMPKNEDIENLKYEFCNYVLGLMKNKNLI